MKIFQNFSIKNKLVIIIVGVSAFSMILGLGLNIFNDINNFKKELLNNSTMQARLVGEYCIGPLLFQYESETEEILKKLDALPGVLNASIYDKDNNLFAIYNKPEYENFSFPKAKEISTEFSDSYLHIFHPIEYQDENYGIVYLRVSTSVLDDKIVNHLLTMLLLIFFLIGIAYVLANRFQRLISVPILNLADVTQKISEQSNYSLRVDVIGKDEISILYRRFNKMFENIQLRESERDAALKALKESEEKFRKVFESSNDAMMLLHENKFIECNNATLRVFGYNTRDEFCGKDPNEVSPPIQPDGKNSRKASDERITEAFRKGNCFFEWTHRRLNGEDFLAEVLLTSVEIEGRKIVQATVRDITKRKRAQESLRQSEEMLNSFMESATDGFFLYDSDLNMVEINKAALEIFPIGTRKEHVIGKNIINIIPGIEETNRYKKYLDIIKTGKPFFIVDLVSIPKFGNRHFSVRAFKVGEGLGIIITDTTDRKRAEIALQKAHDELEVKVAERTKELSDANFRLQEADRMKSVFLANMSHELRTPLNSIIGFSGMILMGMTGDLNTEQKKQLTMVKNSAQHLLNLINDILDISKIEAGKTVILPEEFNINDVVQEVMDMVIPLVNKKGFEIVGEISEQIMIFSDRKRVKQILMNLVGNSVKFTDKGSVKIESRVLKNENLEVNVIDTGIGIQKEDIGKLFNFFQQVDMSSTKKHEGTGLGLYLSKKLVSLLGGDITVKSEYGKGSVFTVKLPLKYVETK